MTTQFDNAQALTEGWMLSERDDGHLQVQMDDDQPNVFDGDFQAFCFVKARALAGSDYHRRAVDLHGTEA